MYTVTIMYAWCIKEMYVHVNTYIQMYIPEFIVHNALRTKCSPFLDLLYM